MRTIDYTVPKAYMDEMFEDLNTENIYQESNPFFIKSQGKSETITQEIDDAEMEYPDSIYLGHILCKAFEAGRKYEKKMQKQNANRK